MTERARGNSGGFYTRLMRRDPMNLSDRKTEGMWNFLFPGASEAAVGTHEPVGLSLRRASIIFSMRHRTFSLGRERILPRTVPNGRPAVFRGGGSPAYRSLHKVERIINESFGEYFRIPRLHGGEELAGRLFRCNGCEVYAADRFGEVDPFDAVVSPKEGVGQRYVVNDALQFGDGYGCFAVGLLDFQPISRPVVRSKRYSRRVSDSSIEVPDR